jgi:hypothetical protein
MLGADSIVMPNPFRATQRLALVAAIVLASGCANVATPPEPVAPLPRTAEPPKPKINLDGFPLPYRQGYADGCASATGAERKDATRFAGDGNYRVGWTDGRGLCARK